MQKRRPKKLVLNRETVRELNGEETRRAIAGDGDGGSQAADSCVGLCGRIHIPIP